MEYRIAVLGGDGIGPEVTAEAVRVLKVVGAKRGHSFRFTEGPIGGNAIDRFGTALPEETVRLVKQSDAVLLGAVGGPKWDDPRAATRPEAGLLALRKTMGVFANLRPVKVFPQLLGASPLKPSLLEGVDIVVVRELTGGLYFSKPKRRWQTARGRRGVDTLKYTEREIRRILQVAFALAQGRRKKVTSVDKANVLETSRLWRELANEVAGEYPDVTLEHMLVDTAAMQLVRSPARFDVLVTENMFGDILTDEAAVLAGSMGLLPSASLAAVPRPGKRAKGLYEPIHGSAPDIAGKGIANPIAAILSAALLLRYSLGLEEEASLVERAVATAIADGCRTPDIVQARERTSSTREVGELIAHLV
ncbi:MAG: 3-isopropylmalate dehydrogenase [Dehalococcoidia bacterium]|nr:3-isopropylmalate dehydrogenase [Dehalococcoidia bacterium]